MKNKKIIFTSKNKPLMGNNRSFSNRASHRKFNTNRQKFLLGGEKYYLSVKLFRAYWAKMRKSL